MKNILLLFLLLNTYLGSAQSDEFVILNLKPKPNLDYTTTMITEMDSEIEYLGDQKFIDEMAKHGIENPMNMGSITTVKSNMKTGKLKDDNSFSLFCTYDSLTVTSTGIIAKLKNTKPITMMKGTQIYGSFQNDEMKIDSIVNLENDQLRTSLEQNMRNMFNQIKFPQKEIHIGESVTVKNPMTIPVTKDVAFDINIVSTYHFDSIKDSLAYFTVVQEIELKTDTKDLDFTMDGHGKGKFIYNREFDSVDHIETKMFMDSIIDIKGMKMKSKATTLTILKNEVKQNNDDN